MGAHPEVLPLAILYLRIYSSGFRFILLYNYEVAIFRSTGDTKTPLIGLYSSDINVVEAGIQRLIVISTLVFLETLFDTPTASMRMFGHSVFPAIFVVTGTCIFRIVWAFFVFPMHKTPFSLFIVYPISWVLTGSMCIIANFIITSKIYWDAEIEQREREVLLY